MAAPSSAHDLNDKRDRTADVLCDAVVSFGDMQLRDSTTRGLTAAGFQTCSPIQARAIPLARSGLDLLVQAKSGTGKTLVFVVAILEATKTKVPAPQSLVLAPTREIAIQIELNLRRAGAALAGFRVESFIGGLDVAEDRRKVQNCHCVVGTPGRLLHLMKNNVINCASIALLVLDEADQLMGSDSFRKDVRAISQRLGQKTQTIALSATFERGIDEQLARLMHRTPIGVTPKREVPILLGVKQYVHTLPPLATKMNTMQEMYAKVKAVNEIFDRVPFSQCLLFLNSNARAESYSNYLSQSGYPTDVIMGRMEQSQRLHTFKRFRLNESRILVCTDLMARGVDSENVNLVINLDVPINSTCYLHRIGRAGRYGTRGMSVTLLCDAEDEQRFGALLGSLGGRAMSVLRFPMAAADADVWEWDTNDVREKCFGVELVGSRRAEEQAMQAIRRKVKMDKERTEVEKTEEEADGGQAEVGELMQQSESEQDDSSLVSSPAKRLPTTPVDTTDDDHMAISDVESSPQPQPTKPNDWDALINKFASNVGCPLSPKVPATTIVEQNQLLLSAAASMIDSVRPTAGDQLPADLFGSSAPTVDNQAKPSDKEPKVAEGTFGQMSGAENAAPVPNLFESLLSKLSAANNDTVEPAMSASTTLLIDSARPTDNQLPADLFGSSSSLRSVERSQPDHKSESPVACDLPNGIDVTTTECAVAPVSDLFDNLLSQLCGATKALNPNSPSFAMPSGLVDAENEVRQRPTELPVELFSPSTATPMDVTTTDENEPPLSAATELIQPKDADSTSVSFAPNDQHFERLLSMLCGGSGNNRTRLEPIPEVTSAKLIDAEDVGQSVELPIDLFGPAKLAAAPMEMEVIKKTAANNLSAPDSTEPASHLIETSEVNTTLIAEVPMTNGSATQIMPPLHVVLNLPFNNEFHNDPPLAQTEQTDTTIKPSGGGQQPSSIPGIMWQPVAAKQKTALEPLTLPARDSNEAADLNLLADAEVVASEPETAEREPASDSSSGDDDDSDDSYQELHPLTVVRAKLRWSATFRRQLQQIQKYAEYVKQFNGDVPM